jgi:ornithine cyclodeaminase/alanine dehydrogenase-like protein (mu-crystallin family)
VNENPQFGRKNDQEITIADLTGLAIQDIQIAKAVLEVETK